MMSLGRRLSRWLTVRSISEAGTSRRMRGSVADRELRFSRLRRTKSKSGCRRRPMLSSLRDKNGGRGHGCHGPVGTQLVAPAVRNSRKRRRPEERMVGSCIQLADTRNVILPLVVYSRMLTLKNSNSYRLRYRCWFSPVAFSSSRVCSADVIFLRTPRNSCVGYSGGVSQ